MTEAKKTVGQRVVEHELKGLTLDDDIREYTKAMSKDIANDLLALAERSRHHDIYKNKDFYVVFTMRPDPVLKHAVPIMWARQSCPSPVYRQTAYKYNHTSGELILLWNIPQKERYLDILNNKLYYLQDKGWANAAKTVILMDSGELLEWVKKENGEKRDAIIKITPMEGSNA